MPPRRQFRRTTSAGRTVPSSGRAKATPKAAAAAKQRISQLRGVARSRSRLSLWQTSAGIWPQEQRSKAEVPRGAAHRPACA